MRVRECRDRILYMFLDRAKTSRCFNDFLKEGNDYTLADYLTGEIVFESSDKRQVSGIW